MALLGLNNIRYGFGGGPPLLDGVSFQVERGERVCLLGRNGSGKSTLLKIARGDVQPDGGEIALEKGARLAYLEQEVPRGITGTVYDAVAAGWAGHPGAEASADEQRVQVNTVLNRLRLDGDLAVEELSGGLKRRVLLARALAGEPDMLLLDEPTNHLDIDAILWMEEFLLRYVRTLLFVTHDRAFLRRLATRILEIDRGALTSWACNYDTYLERKGALLEAEEKQRALFDKKLTEEEAWVRRGVKARTTRNEGRVRALKEMRRERQERRERAGSVHLLAQNAMRSGNLVCEIENAGFGYGGTPLLHDVSAAIMRGDKVGIIGANGSGKTTLLRLLLGELQPQEGTVQLGTRLQPAYFDQLRAGLEEDKSVQDNVNGGNDTVTVNGMRRHIIGYLEDFLFTRDRARSPVGVLSGGERSRLLLARLFAQPSNLLVLDEPTNDLDVETLDLLEALLVEYKGTVLVVSHDRDFLNSVVTSTLVLEGEGRVGEYVGGYDDWLRQRAALAGPAGLAAKPAPTAKSIPASPAARPRRLSNRERGELDTLPQRIEALEHEQEEINARLGDPDIYKQGDAAAAPLRARLAEIAKELETAFARWEALDAAHAATLNA